MSAVETEVENVDVNAIAEGVRSGLQAANSEPATPAYDQAQAKAAFVFNGLKRTEGVKSVWGVMRTDDFMSIRGFGLNRDVTKRIEKEKNVHLKGEITSAQQFNVALVLTSEGSGDFYKDNQPFMKIDGHSRCEAWEKGTLAKPEFVNVQFFFDLSSDEIIKEYRVFTNSLAQATIAEQNQIDKKLNSFEPKSKFVKASWRDAFAKIGCDSHDAGLKEYGEMLLTIVDEWKVTPDKGKASTKRHSTGVKAAILRTYDKDDYTDWEIFWKDFFAPASTISKCEELRKTVRSLGTHNAVRVKDACEDAFRDYMQAKA